MSIIKNWKGSWGTPDLGITEGINKIINGGTTQQGGSNLLQPSVQQYVAPLVQQKTGLNIGTGGTNYTAPTYTPPPVDNITPPSPQVKGISTSNSIPSSVNSNEAINSINQNVDQYTSLIDQDYNNAISYLNSQEAGIRNDAGIAQNEIGTGYQSAINNLGIAQSEAETGIGNQVATGEKEANSALREARDVFRQTQQNNIAQLSGAGLSSSSVNEALAERLGVETARRIASVTGNLSEIRQNASKELSRIGQYYSNKKTELEQTKLTEIAKIKSSLTKSLDQINFSRATATSDKAKQRYDLFNNAQSQIASIKQQTLQFEQSLKTWAAKNTEALTPFATDENFLKSISTATNNFNTQFAPSGFQYVPQVTTTPEGRVSGTVKYNLQKKDEPYTTTQGGSTSLTW